MSAAEQTTELDLDSAMDAAVEEIGEREAGTDASDKGGDLDTAIDKAANASAVEADAEATSDDKGVAAGATAGAKPEDAELPVPQSWKKEMHEHWGKIPKPAQQYYLERERQMLEGLQGYKTDAELARGLKPVLAKYENILREQGLQPAQALDFLFNAHRILSDTRATPEQRTAYLRRVAETYGLTLPQAAAAAVAQADGGAAQSAAVSPEIRAAMERVERIEAALREKETREYEAIRSQTAADVEAFASDPKHAYFDECADEIAVFVKAGLKLADAYEKAVYANPVTRQKELSRIQQETDRANAEKVKEAAKAAKKATSTNVKGRDTTRTPTGTRATVANMDEVIREIYAEIKDRT